MQSQWDLDTQEFHGGQSWRSCNNFVTDFSVTTNAFGPPQSAIKAASEALSNIHHYPSASASEAKHAIAKFCDWPSSRMLLGNGASEFIDLLMKLLPHGPFAPTPYIATYQEYHRAARASGRQVIDLSVSQLEGNITPGAVAPAVLVCIRPNSPTGEILSLHHLEKLLKTIDSHVIVDESFLPFAGPNWRQLSALNLIDDFPNRLIVVQSWTKLWSCAGLRLGSVCASSQWIKEIKRLQTPWSCNSIAQQFAIRAANDRAYLEQTWTSIAKWRKLTVKNLTSLGWKVSDKSPGWIPWVLVECSSKQVAAIASKTALKAGCPVRHCASYGLPTYLRIAVRQPEHQAVLFEAWRSQFSDGVRMPIANGNGNGNGALTNGISNGDIVL